MYCKNCGHPIQDTDRFCSYCGFLVGQEAESVDQNIQEEVIYNSPLTSAQEAESSHYPREISLVFEEKEEALASAVPHSIMAEEGSQEEQREPSRDFSEFSWNIQDFPKPKKVDQVPIRWGTDSLTAQTKGSVADEPFVWNLGNMSEQYREKREEESVRQPTEKSIQEPCAPTISRAEGSAHHELSSEEADRIRRLEEEIFGDVKPAKNRSGSSAEQTIDDNLDCFFTFSKKNEEFQKLLDQEYEKVQRGSREESHGETQFVSETTASSMEEERTAPLMSQGKPQSVQMTPEMLQFSQAKSEDFQAKPEAFQAESMVPQLSQAKPQNSRNTKPISRDEVKEAVKNYIINLGNGEETPSVCHAQPPAKASFVPDYVPPDHILDRILPDELLPSQSEQTERQFPGQTVRQTAGQAARENLEPAQRMGAPYTDFHEIKEEVPHQDQVKRPVGYVNPQADEMVQARAGFFGSTASLDYVQVEQEESREKQDVSQVQEKTEGKIQAETSYDPTAAPGNFYYEGPGSSQKKKGPRIIKWTILVIVILVLVGEGTMLGVKYFAPQSVAADMIQKAEQKVISLFQKKDGVPIVGSDQTAGQGGYVKKENLPTATMEELILQQIGNNYNNNIVKVEANPELQYEPQKDYGVGDVNGSLPITDNFWLESDGVRYNYDATAVGTVIAYCSRWMDFVNKGDGSVFGMIAPGGGADQWAKEYKPTKGVHQTITLLQLGEIRRGANGFYIWTKEDISIAKGKKTEEKQQNYIYYMAPNGHAFQVIDYYPY